MLNNSRLAPSTQAHYADALAHACEAFGEVYVDALEPDDFRRWLAKETDSHVASTLNGWLRVARRVLADALADGMIPSNPASAVRPFKEGKTQGRRGRALTPEQFALFIRTVPTVGLAPDVARMLLVHAWTGCRRGEVIGLRFSDLQDGELVIQRSVWNGHEKSTKSGEPRRVAVVEPLREVIDAQRRWLFERQHPGLVSGLMFPASPEHARRGAERRGGPLSWFRSGSALTAPLRKVVEVAGLPEISLHSLRRTYEDLLRRSGVDALTRRALAGWRSSEIQEVYASIGPEERQAAGASVLRLVRRTTSDEKPDGEPDGVADAAPNAAPDAAPGTQKELRPESVGG